MQLTLKSVKGFFQISAVAFTGPVRTDVHEYRRVVIADGGHFFTFAGDHSGGDKFVVFVPSVSSGQTSQGGFGIKFGFAAHHRVIAGLYPVPAVVTVKGVKTSAQAGDAAYTQLPE